MAPRVSIVVLDYNYALYLPAALDSALGQRDVDVEVVVVDDGSTDGSAQVIRSYGGRVVPVLKANGGQASAMNAGFAASSGDVVLFLDADDVLEPHAAARVAAVFEADPATAWVMFRLRLVDGDGRDLGRVRPRRADVMPDGDLREHLRRFRCFHWQPTSGNAFRRSALEQVLPVPEPDYRISADAYLAAVVPLCGPVRSTDEVLGAYRLHGASNYASVAVDDGYFRAQIDRQVVSHRHARRVAERLGVPFATDVRAPADAAFLGFRLASLVLDPGRHPFPDDRRVRLALRGLGAALRNPRLAWPNRLRRSVWFAACAVAPAGLARRLARDWAPDTPARRARLTARG